MELAFGIVAYAASTPQPSNEPAVCWRLPNEARAEHATRPPVPLLLRRRVSSIGQAALRVAWALPPAGHPRFIFASRHGEFDRTLTMLEQVAIEDGPSPADFSLGVHNALAGLLSICTGNHAGHTALAAGVDSFGFGLVEAATCLLEQPEQPVMLVYYDAALPPGYPDTSYSGTAQQCSESDMALALVLVSPNQDSQRVIMATRPIAESHPVEPAAAVFLRFLQTSAPEAYAVGECMTWHWRHV